MNFARGQFHGNRRGRRGPWGLLAVLAAGAALLAGCNIAGFLGYLVAPERRTRTVDAEHDLAGQTVAVVIYAPSRVLFEHPYARLYLADAIAEQLEAHVEGVKVVPPGEVIRYQQDHVYWEDRSRTELGREFSADRLLYVSLVDYATREPGSPHLCRGRIVAEASLYDCARRESEGLLWRESDLRAVYPEDNPVPANRTGDVQKIAYKTRAIFVDRLVKSFYEHEEEIPEDSR
jgi:hypothetical protein